MRKLAFNIGMWIMKLSMPNRTALSVVVIHLPVTMDQVRVAFSKASDHVIEDIANSVGFKRSVQ